MRRQILPAVLLTAALALLTGVAYPLVVTGVSRAAFPYRSNGSLISHHDRYIGSALLGQNFVDKQGNPDPKYFQPRPSASGLSGYDPTGATCQLPGAPASCGASGASNLGPGDPKLVGFIPGFNTVDLKGNPSRRNPFANSGDAYCVPTDKQGNPVTSPSPGQKYAKNSDGTYVCDSNTVPERASSYRQLNNLSDKAVLPVDAVTASNSGLDPDISAANANLQAQRVADARHLSKSRVLSLIRDHTNSRAWGVLGEKTINVLDLNLALDNLH
jgi:K+-transporting ATPase ATPase C chain